MNFSKPKLLAVLVALQCAFLLGLIGKQEFGLKTGRVVLLETQPVDPRDLLMGDYLILSYKISSLPPNLFSPPVKDLSKPGTPVWVVLEKRGQYYEAKSASLQQPSAKSGEIVIKGQATENWMTSQLARVAYGLERFYVREGTGNTWQTGVRNQKITVEVSVDSSGQGRIKQVFLDGKPYAAVMKDFAR